MASLGVLRAAKEGRPVGLGRVAWVAIGQVHSSSQLMCAWWWGSYAPVEGLSRVCMTFAVRSVGAFTAPQSVGLKDLLRLSIVSSQSCD